MKNKRGKKAIWTARRSKSVQVPLDFEMDDAGRVNARIMRQKKEPVRE
jgi:hypothetical protein